MRALFFVLGLTLAAWPLAARAQRDRVGFGGDVVVGAGEAVDSVAVFGGQARIDGRVEGDAVAFGGDVVLGPGAEVGGSVASIGGRVDAAPGAQVRSAASRPVPWAGWRPARSEPGPLSKLGQGLLLHGLLFLLALVLWGAVPARLAALQGAIVRDPVRTGLTGLAGYVGGALLTVLLALSILGIPAALALAVLLPLATYVGLCATASVVGAALPLEPLRGQPVRQLAAGVSVLFVASLVPVLGTVLVGLASCLGLGAILRTRLRPSLPAEPAGLGAGPYRTA